MSELGFFVLGFGYGIFVCALGAYLLARWLVP